MRPQCLVLGTGHSISTADLSDGRAERASYRSDGLGGGGRQRHALPLHLCWLERQLDWMQSGQSLPGSADEGSDVVRGDLVHPADTLTVRCGHLVGASPLGTFVIPEMVRPLLR